MTVNGKSKTSQDILQAFGFTELEFWQDGGGSRCSLPHSFEQVFTWFRRRQWGPPAGMSVGAVWLGAFGIIFAVGMNEQALVSKLAIGKDSKMQKKKKSTEVSQQKETIFKLMFIFWSLFIWPKSWNRLFNTYKVICFLILVF